MSKKSCELCTNKATMFCESDEASLCWDCDENVHSANFLVAKHSRTLLCHVCCSPTSWKASGLKLGPIFSACHACSNNNTGDSTAAQIVHIQDFCVSNSQESKTDDNGKHCSDSDSDYYSEEEEEEEEIGNRHVVPWECPSKRMRESDVCEDGCCYSNRSI